MVIAHQARLDHGVTLPVTSLLLVVIFQCGKAHDQRTAIAKRPQPHIYTIDKAIHGGLIQYFDQPLAHTGKELSIIELTPSAARGAVFRPGENKVDVRGKVEFAAPQLAHAQNQQRLRVAVGITGRTKITAAILIYPVARPADQHLG